MKKHKCKRCEHSWFPRKVEKPTVCPECKSPYWNKKRKETYEDPAYEHAQEEGRIAYEKTLASRYD